MLTVMNRDAWSLVVVLAIRVTLLRTKLRVGSGHGNDPDLARAEPRQVLDPVADDAFAEDRGRGERSECGQVRNRWPVRRADEQRLHQ